MCRPSGGAQRKTRTGDLLKNINKNEGRSRPWLGIIAG